MIGLSGGFPVKKGAFTFVLHSHLPYSRKAGRWPHGEEWLHEGISETYLPLLNALYDLKDEGCPFKLTLGLTPVLVEQLDDKLILEHFRIYIEDKIKRAAGDIARFEKESNGHLAYLARYYREYYQNLLNTFENRFGGRIIGPLKILQDEGNLEILTSAATHAYLPLLERDSSVYGQLRTGTEAYRRHFGRSPRGIWLPECGYRPAIYAGTGSQSYRKPGFEYFLANLGIGLFFAETHTIEGGEPVGKATGAIIGPYGDIPRRYVVPLADYKEPTMKTTFLPYWVQSTEPSVDVAVVGRNNRTGMQVWSADWGYPGDFDYREFHKKDGVSGLQYWRVTNALRDLGDKDYYYPDWAAGKVEQHASHFVTLVTEMVADFYSQNQKQGIVAAAYDTELFGHWWFEGVTWVKQVLKQLATSETVELTTASDYIEKHPPEDVLALKEGSWGQAGNHFTWLNTDTEWMWPLIHNAEIKMEQLVVKYPEAKGENARHLNQAARELLLLESSDWPFLITTGQAREYAIKRFQEHVERFETLADIALTGKINAAAQDYYHEVYELDNIFPDIDYRNFANRELQR
jgi:1,4-alpha-glucan branching enzyme